LLTSPPDPAIMRLCEGVMKKLWILFGLPFLMTTMLGACGSVVTGGGPENGSSWASYCETRAAACGNAATACKTQEPCARALLRDEIEDTLFECLASNCNEDVCFQEIVAQFPRTLNGEQFSTAHEGYLGACPSGNDDVALAAWLVTDDLLDDYRTCATTSDCAASDACFQQMDAQHVEGCDGWL
jgi:hypothetical protein